jgi:glycerophosphoryl diester phosphodiesterase
MMFTLNVLASDVVIHGHRGARAVRPENTIPAFEYAISAGVDVLELDLAVTSDNVLVVSHDPHVNPVLCKDAPAKVAIRSLTLEELKQFDCGSLKNPAYPKQEPVPGTTIPTLGEVFALSNRGKFEFNIETKIFAKEPELAPSPEDFAKLVFDMVTRHRLEERVILQSFDFRTLHAMKKLSQKIRLPRCTRGRRKALSLLPRKREHRSFRLNTSW